MPLFIYFIGDSMNNTTLAFLITTLAGLSTMIGSILIFIFKKNNKILISSLAFAAGVMICVSLTDLIPESIHLFKQTFLPFPAILLCSIGISIGVIISMFLDKKLPTMENSRLYKVGIISMLAIIMHNIPEGIATFLTTSENTKLGLSLAIAITLHNIPEGISISIPIYYATKNKKKALLYTFISGISEPFGALLAYVFLSNFVNDIFMGFLYAIIAGIMMQISIYELLTTSLSYKNKTRTIAFLIIGAIFMYISHILF